MNKFLILLSREIKSYFYSPIAYFVLCFFLVATGVSFYFDISIMNHQAVQYSLVEAFFNTVLFWICFILIFPLITMRLFAEEFKMGTIETLATAPIKDWQIVLSKFFGCLFFYIVLWLPTPLYFYAFNLIANSGAGHVAALQVTAAPAAGAYWGSYLLMLLMGMFYISIGCFASVLTKNQIVSAIICFAALIVIFFSGLLTFVVLNVTPFFRDLVGYFSAIEHMVDFSRGIIDSRPIVYYLSMTALMLFLTLQVFQYRKWRA